MACDSSAIGSNGAMFAGSESAGAAADEEDAPLDPPLIDAEKAAPMLLTAVNAMKVSDMWLWAAMVPVVQCTRASSGGVWQQ